jgi:hypothetical protein
MTQPTAAEFQAALPDGWCVEIKQFTEGWTARAFNVRYGSATIGPKRKLVPADVGFLRSRVDDVIAPPLTYSQWLASGQRFGFAVAAEDTPLTRGLRLLAICIERGDVSAPDVAQALFKPDTDTYTLRCPVAEASSSGRAVSELWALLADAADQHGQPFAWPEAAEQLETATYDTHRWHTGPERDNY